MKKTNSLGVIIGRFQVDELHEGHIDILLETSNTNNQMLVVIGLGPCKCTIRNPLDYDTRRRMILEYFPNAKVAYINDLKSDADWSEVLDNLVSKYSIGFDTVTLYGCRDSFIKHYSGKFPTQELVQRIFISGTEIRKRIAAQSQNSKAFRAGCIWYSLNQWPKPSTTVDIAIINKDIKHILLGRKQTEDKYRLIGGFARPGETFEISASRELQEETHLVASSENLCIEKSFFIDDWRYRNEVDKITTVLYTVFNWDGVPSPDDDIHELQWFKLNPWICDRVVPEHLEMLMYLINKYGDK